MSSLSNVTACMSRPYSILVEGGGDDRTSSFVDTGEIILHNSYNSMKTTFLISCRSRPIFFEVGQRTERGERESE
jgi:hypothetical protein